MRYINMNVTYGSAIVLDESIPKFTRLLLIVVAFAVGLLGNGILITALNISHNLRHSTVVSIGSMCVCDTLLCLILFPMSAAALFSTMTHKETTDTCLIQWILVLFEINLTSIIMLLMAWESAFYLCYGQTTFGNLLSWIVKSRLRAFCFHCTIWFTAFFGASVQYLSGFNYCTKTMAHAQLQFLIMTVLIVIPCSISLLTYTWLFCVISHPHPRIRRSEEYQRDYVSAKSNYICLIIFMVVVSPLVTVVVTGNVNVISIDAVYNMVWVILFKIPVTPFICALSNKKIRPKFIKVFYYIFCKVSLDARVPPMLSPNVVRGKTRVHLLFDFRYPRQDSYV